MEEGRQAAQGAGTLVVLGVGSHRGVGAVPPPLLIRTVGAQPFSSIVGSHLETGFNKEVRGVTSYFQEFMNTEVSEQKNKDSVKLHEGCGNFVVVMVSSHDICLSDCTKLRNTLGQESLTAHKTQM